MYGLEPLIPIALFFSVAAVVILRGPLGRALAERLAGGPAAHPDERVDVLLEAVNDLRERVGELEERQDFAERVLSRQREPQALPGETTDG